MSEEDGNDGQAGPDHADPLLPSGKQDCYLVPIKGRHLWYFSLSGFDECFHGDPACLYDTTIT